MSVRVTEYNSAGSFTYTTTTGNINSLYYSQYPEWSVNYAGGGFKIMGFDEKKPYVIVEATTGATECYETLEKAREGAAAKITANKGKWVIFKGLEIVEPKPVETRTRKIG